MPCAGPGDGLIENDGLAGAAVVLIALRGVVDGTVVDVTGSRVVAGAAVVGTSVVGGGEIAVVVVVVDVAGSCDPKSGSTGAATRTVRLGLADPLRSTTTARPVTARTAAATKRTTDLARNATGAYRPSRPRGEARKAQSRKVWPFGQGTFSNSATCFALSDVNGARSHPAHRSRRRSPAILAMRSSSDGQT